MATTQPDLAKLRETLRKKSFKTTIKHLVWLLPLLAARCCAGGLTGEGGAVDNNNKKNAKEKKE